MIPKYMDIRDRKQLNELLSALQPGTRALWGKLQAQNMIEHLIEAVEYTNGKKIAELIYGPGEAMTQKKWQFMLILLYQMELKALLVMPCKTQDSKTCLLQ